MIEKGNGVLYVDGLGKENVALVTAVNQRGDFCPVCQSNTREERKYVGGALCTNDSYHNSEMPTEHYVTLVYVDVHRADSDNLVKMYDVKHISMLERETNPDLPTFHVNCWKYEDEDHRALPVDHPAFDHPFKTPEYDEDGVKIDTGRPQLAAAVNDHHETSLQAAVGSSAVQPASGPDADPILHQGTAPERPQEAAPETPAETDAQRLHRETAEAGAVAAKDPLDASLVDTSIEVVKGVPTAEDLDKAAVEQKAADDTAGGSVLPAGWDGPLPPRSEDK